MISLEGHVFTQQCMDRLYDLGEIGYESTHEIDLSHEGLDGFLRRRWALSVHVGPACHI